jgi:hypothetical protein
MITKICTTFWTLTVAAWAAPSQAACNNGTILGEYAALANAWNGTTPPYTPVAALRKVTFDGVGGFKSSGSLSVAGAITNPFTLNGKYTVNADCTMTQTTTTPTSPNGGPPIFFGVIAADSNKIYQIRSDANTETIVFERLESVGQNENAQ